ncbi:hypothetical protein quinque_014930 [Culex quinquefasciatus]
METEEVTSRVTQLELSYDTYEADCSSSSTEPLPVPDAASWLQFGVHSRDMTRETAYCDERLVREVFALRSSLDEQDARKVRTARNRSNFFEFKAGQFMNRAAVKIANVDAAFGWELCKLVGEEKGEEEEELMYFVDVFGGPGGCSEYILWRNGGWKARGFGFTTYGDYEFQPEYFRAVSPETLDPFYGANDDGNLFDPGNIRGFIDYVMAHTGQAGVHLLVCDGGFLLKNNCQEVISKQLYLVLVMLAVTVIRPGGNAIIKVFDLYTPFSVGLIFILTRMYARVSILKPCTSRPANSERYVVCQKRLNKCPDMGEFLFSVNKVMWENSQDMCESNQDYDILQLVAEDLIQNDADFCHFIRNSNDKLASRQIDGLKALIDALQPGYRPKPIDHDFVQETLWRFWKLDHKSALAPTADARTKSAPEYAAQFVDAKTFELFRSSGNILNGSRPLRQTFGSPHDWSFVALDVSADKGKNIRTMFVSKGNGNVFFYDKKKSEWRQIKEYQLILSPRTVLYGEIVEEIQVKNNRETRVYALHIIDAIVLGGVDVRALPLAKRSALCAKFATALNRPLCHLSTNPVRPIPVRAKQLYALAEMEHFFANVTIYTLESGTKVIGCAVERFDPRETQRFYIPRALLFVRHSQEAGRVLSFERSFRSRQVWIWSRTNQLYSAGQYADVEREPGLVYRVEFEEFIDESEDAD